jgi:hypothetical protein
MRQTSAQSSRSMDRIWTSDIGTLFGRKDYEKHQFFLDINKAVFNPGVNKDRISGVHCMRLLANDHLGPTTNNVVKFVFFMGRLLVGITCTKNVDAGAHSRYTQKFVVTMILSSFLDQSC